MSAAAAVALAEMRAARSRERSNIRYRGLNDTGFDGWGPRIRAEAKARFFQALAAYRLSKTHDLEYCVRLTKAGVDVRALGGGL